MKISFQNLNIVYLFLAHLSSYIFKDRAVIIADTAHMWIPYVYNKDIFSL